MEPTKSHAVRNMHYNGGMSEDCQEEFDRNNSSGKKAGPSRRPSRSPSPSRSSPRRPNRSPSPSRSSPRRPSRSPSPSRSSPPPVFSSRSSPANSPRRSGPDLRGYLARATDALFCRSRRQKIPSPKTPEYDVMYGSSGSEFDDDIEKDIKYMKKQRVKKANIPTDKTGRPTIPRIKK